jgi:SWI/SNF-related matrix-associated actin-dependent regulator of chromatin subfamily A3
MSSLGKRRATLVDLTSDDNNRQRQRVSQSGSTSSQLQVSQTHNARDAWGTQRNEDDSLEIVDLSQDIDEGAGWLCIGAIDAKIVGVRYYNGYASMNEQVMVKREPGNPYDSNAIRINNVHGTQIGHIPKVLASKLAPYMVKPSQFITGLHQR